MSISIVGDIGVHLIVIVERLAISDVLKRVVMLFTVKNAKKLNKPRPKMIKKGDIVWWMDGHYTFIEKLSGDECILENPYGQKLDAPVPFSWCKEVDQKTLKPINREAKNEEG